MTALYNLNSINLPHVDLYRWAADRKLIFPLDVKGIPEQEKLFLKMLAMKQYFVKMSPEQEAKRFSAAMKEAMEHLPSNGLSDKTIILLHVAGTIFIAVLYFSGAKL